MEILAKNKTLLLGLLTVPPDKEREEWLVGLRLESENAEPK